MARIRRLVRSKSTMGRLGGGCHHVVGMSFSKWQKPIVPSTIKLVSWTLLLAVVSVMAGEPYAMTLI